MADRFTDDPKFYVSSKISFEHWPDLGEGKFYTNTGDKKIAVVYQTWSTEWYLPYIYHSMLSQMMYTDVLEMADIYLFVDEERYDFAIHLFRNLIAQDQIIKIQKEFAVKYMITTNPILKKYEVVSVVDADMFFYSDTKVDFYKNVLTHTEKSDQPIAINVSNDAPSVFFGRRDNLCTSIPQSEYINFMADSLSVQPDDVKHWLINSQWALSCIFIYKTKFFDDPKYYKHALINTYAKQYCDETVWLGWTAMHGLKTLDVTDDLGYDVIISIPFEMSILEENKPGKLLLIHPLVGTYRINDDMVAFIKQIQDNFRLFVIESQE
jgi:hypothetical protein